MVAWNLEKDTQTSYQLLKVEHVGDLMWEMLTDGCFSAMELRISKTFLGELVKLHETGTVVGYYYNLGHKWKEWQQPTLMRK